MLHFYTATRFTFSPPFTVVEEPQPGDVIAIAAESEGGASGHVGIVVCRDGKLQAASATASKVVVNDWGFREGQKPVFRRFNGEGIYPANLSYY